MRFCVYGAGAIGGHLGAKLAAGGHDVSIVARGEHLSAMRANGLTLRAGEKIIHGRVRASEHSADLGVQDFVLVTLKATALPSFAENVSPLLGPDTAVVFIQNGIPWWYNYGLGASRRQAPDLSRLDPGGRLAGAIAKQHIVGATIYTSNEVVAPGVIANDSVGENTLIVGEIDDMQSARISALRTALEGAEIGSPVTNDIRATLWRRLLVNIAGSVVCMLIEQPIGVAQADPEIGAVYARLSREGAAVALAYGIDVGAGTVPAGTAPKFPTHHKPSILQDYERRRPLEIEQILLTPLAMARAAGVDTPALEVVTALAAARASKEGLFYREQSR